MDFIFPASAFTNKKLHVDLVRLMHNYYAIFSQMSRSSGKCYKIWLSMKQYESLAMQLEEISRRNLDFGYEEMFEPRFLMRRSFEAGYHLPRLYTHMTSAVTFLLNFQRRRKETGYLRGKINDTTEKEARISTRIEGELRAALHEWQTYLETNEFQDIADATARETAIIEFRRSVNTFWVKSVRDIRHPKGNQDLFSELQALLDGFKNRTARHNTQINRHRFQVLYLAALDANRALNHTQFKILLGSVKDVLIKQLGLGTTTVDDDSPVQGVQGYGSFEVRSLSKIHKDNFDFTRTAITRNFTYFPNGPGADDRIILNTSLLAAISITDRPTLNHLKIPAEAAFYQCVYPLHTTEQIFQTGDNAPTCLLKFGGYVYYNAEHIMIQVNGLKPEGTDLYFDGPNIITPAMAQQITALGGDSLFKPVTLRNILASGGIRYTWIPPGQLGVRNHGCFVVKQRDPNLPMVFFNVINVVTGQLLDDMGTAIQDNNLLAAQHYEGFLFNGYNDIDNV